MAKKIKLNWFCTGNLGLNIASEITAVIFGEVNTGFDAFVSTRVILLTAMSYPAASVDSTSTSTLDSSALNVRLYQGRFSTQYR